MSFSSVVFFEVLVAAFRPGFWFLTIAHQTLAIAVTGLSAVVIIKVMPKDSCSNATIRVNVDNVPHPNVMPKLMGVG